jgi:predicted O-methyltransferase YrrM
LAAIEIPRDLDAVLDAAWQAAKEVPGYLVEDEARFLGIVVACAPAASGAIVEIGSYKGKSTVMMAKVAKHYGRGPIIAIDPHNFNSPELQEQRSETNRSSFDEYMSNIRNAGVEDLIETHRAYSSDVALAWNRPIRFLWIDGDHTYQGAKGDFEGFSRHVSPEGVVAFHDALHEFSGPIRVFVEDVLRSDQFGAAGFVRSIAWSQFRPKDGAAFQKQRASLELSAKRLIPYVANDQELHGMKKALYKLNRSRVPRVGMRAQEWALLLAPP